MRAHVLKFYFNSVFFKIVYFENVVDDDDVDGGTTIHIFVYV